MEKKGFISTSMVISIIVLAMAIIMVIITNRETNSILEATIAENVKTRLASTKVPNCVFGAAPYMILYENKASATIIMTCSHIDEFINDIKSEVTDETIDLYFSRHLLSDDTYINNENDLKIRLIKAAPYPEDSLNQFRIVLEISSKNEGEYYLRLEKEKFKTKDGFDNREIRSKKILVVEEEI